MERISTIEHLKKRGVKDCDIQMFELHMQGGDESTFKAIAKKFGLKSAVTVSRRIKKVQKATCRDQRWNQVGGYHVGKCRGRRHFSETRGSCTIKGQRNRFVLAR